MSKSLFHKQVGDDRRLTALGRAGGVFGWTALLALSFAVANLIAVLIIKALLVVGLELDRLNAAMFSLIVASLVYVLFAGLMISFPWLVLKIKTSWQDLGYSSKLAWKSLIALPTAIIIYLLLSIVFMMIASQFSGFDQTEVQQTGFKDLTQSYEYIAAFIALVIIAPVVEETLFRGFLHTRMRKLTGRFGAIVIVSALFGAIHLQLNVAVDTFALGLVLGLLREYTGSIYSSIALHMIKNGLAYYLLFLAPFALPAV